MANNINCPTLFIIGGKDLRVPAGQGIYIHKLLKSRGIETELKYYPEDGHSVASLEPGLNAMMSLFRFWTKHLI